MFSSSGDDAGGKKETFQLCGTYGMPTSLGCTHNPMKKIKKKYPNALEPSD